LNQVEIIAFIAQTALTYIFVAIATGNAQKQTVLDQKTDLRTTKEDIMSELKDSRQSLLREQEAATKALKDVLTATIKAEIEQATKERKSNEY
jgi:TRAP-type mannitol/chloroaromatic compound transport system substrate-binding protein